MRADITTKQQAFDVAVRGVFEQGGPGWDDRFGECVYRNDQGLRCAVGQLLSENDLAKDIDGATPADLVKLEILPKWVGKLASDLQKSHDNSFYLDSQNFMQIFLQRCVSVAEEHNLDDSVARQCMERLDQQ